MVTARCCISNVFRGSGWIPQRNGPRAISSVGVGEKGWSCENLGVTWGCSSRNISPESRVYRKGWAIVRAADRASCRTCDRRNRNCRLTRFNFNSEGLRHMPSAPIAVLAAHSEALRHHWVGSIKSQFDSSRVTWPSKGGYVKGREGGSGCARAVLKNITCVCH